MLKLLSSRRKQICFYGVVVLLTVVLWSRDVKLTHKSRDSDVHKPIINEFWPRPLHHDLDLCDTRHVDVLFVVPSAPGNTNRRSRVRQSEIYTFAQDPSNKAALLFFLGSPPTQNIPGIRPGFRNATASKASR